MKRTLRSEKKKKVASLDGIQGKAIKKDASYMNQPENTEVVMGDEGKPELVEFKGTEQEGWYPGKRELTAREEAQRDRDCKVEYSSVVPSAMHKGLDASRRANWIPPSEVEKMPQWNPVLQPVVDEVIENAVKEVADFMGTASREEKAKVVDKLVAKVLKKRPSHDKGLVEKRVWGTLFALLKDQGVTLRHGTLKS